METIKLLIGRETLSQFIKLNLYFSLTFISLQSNNCDKISTKMNLRLTKMNMLSSLVIHTLLLINIQAYRLNSNDSKASTDSDFWQSLNVHDVIVLSLAFDGTGLLASASLEGIIQLWDTKTRGT